ncbi:MAG TPA: carboxypeptidase regulatory-like domain-containing protein, partial [Armatimonadota bacterium]|nr:carboxypeptidase regulatory-like domain-containing protein [Armatimonadota bacterium]
NTRRSFARYNLSTDIWTVLPDGPVPIFGGVGAVINGKLYITRGTQQTSYASGIWEFDVVSEQWQNDTSGNPAPVAHLVKGVEKPGVAVYNNRMYIIGGTSSTGDVKTIQVFDPASKTVTTVGELPEVMTRHGATISPDGILYVGGGRQNGVDATAWWKADLKVTPLNFTRLPDDPACFPYEDWSVGYSISGQVTDPNGAPVASAIIGIKESPNAAADPIKYAVTDSSGNFGQVQLEAGTYYVAAWKEGWTPTPDVVVSLTNEGNMVVDLQFTKPAGANIAAGTTSDKVWASSWDNSNYVPVNAVDGNIATRWSSMNGASQPHVFIVDLRDSANNDRFIDGVTIFWYTGRPAAYQVDVMSGGDPMSFGLWDNPQGSPGTAVTTVYTASNKAGCFIGAERYVSPIRFEAPVKASGLRIVMNGFTDYPGLYGIWELQVHAADGAQTIGRLSDAKALPAGASIVVSGVHLTALPGNGMPSQVAYVEDSDRSCGLRLHLNDVDLSASVGSTVEIEGTVAFTEHDEMYLSVKSVSVIDPTLDPLKPLGMNGRFASQKIAQGLLVKLWGMVISKGAGWFVLEDGSGAAIKVYSTAAV